jgi:hypothetical protein
MVCGLVLDSPNSHVLLVAPPTEKGNTMNLTSETFYCHDCRIWAPVVRPVIAAHDYECRDCGAPILCDECGATWSDSHDCQ